jgi:hypothetical protein
MGPFPPSEISSWVSSDESVGTVESQGTVSCLESGLAYIYATFPTVTYTYFSGTCLENTSSTTSAGQLIVARLTGSVDNPPVFGDSNGGIAGQAFTFRVRAVHPTTGQQVGASGTSTVDFPSLRSGESINPNPVNVSAGAGTTQVVLRVVDDASSGRTYTLLAGGATPGAGQVNLWFPVEMDIERWRNCNFQSCPNLGSYNCMTACVPSGFSQRTEFIALTARVCNRSVWVSYTGPGGSSVSKLTTVQDVGPTTNNPYWNTGNIPGTAGCLSDLLADELGVPNGCNPGPFGRASVLWRFQ